MEEIGKIRGTLRVAIPPPPQKVFKYSAGRACCKEAQEITLSSGAGTFMAAKKVRQYLYPNFSDIVVPNFLNKSRKKEALALLTIKGP